MLAHTPRWKETGPMWFIGGGTARCHGEACRHTSSENMQYITYMSVKYMISPLRTGGHEAHDDLVEGAVARGADEDVGAALHRLAQNLSDKAGGEKKEAAL